MSPAHHHPARRSGTLPAFACLALMVTTLLTGCSAAADTTADPAASSPPSATTTTVSTGAAGAKESAAPAKVAVPSLGISSSLMELGLSTDGTVQVPPAEKGMTAGWYVGGSVPGEAGAAVIIGHNDTRYGKAVFHDLKKIGKGDDIIVTDTLGKAAHFTVTSTESVGKSSFPTEKVYGPTEDRALRLITCDGDFDAQGHPVANLIVYATLG